MKKPSFAVTLITTLCTATVWTLGATYGWFIRENKDHDEMVAVLEYGKKVQADNIKTMGLMERSQATQFLLVDHLQNLKKENERLKERLDFLLNNKENAGERLTMPPKYYQKPKQDKDDK